MRDERRTDRRTKQRETNKLVLSGGGRGRVGTGWGAG